MINYTEKQIRDIVDINVNGCIFCCQHAIAPMAKQKYGKIVNISSGAGLAGDATIAVYAATKYAVSASPNPSLLNLPITIST